jgi:hypothetical protein
MSGALHFEFVQQNVLGALRLVDAVTGVTVSDTARVVAPDLTLLRKRNGDFLVMAAEGLTPAAGRDYPIDVRPASAAYAPRRRVLHLPRDSDPANMAHADSLFQPALIALLPAPSYPTGANFALLRVTVRRSTDQARVGNALVRLTSGRPDVPDGRALTDAAGEALVVIAGVPLASPGPGATVVDDIGANIDALVDPTIATFAADSDLDAARAAARLQTTGFPDPDDIEVRLAATAPAPTPVRLSAGRISFASLAWVPA